MDIVTLIGIFFTFACIIAGFVFEGGNVTALLQLTPALIVIGGTIGALIISFPAETLKNIPKVLKIAFTTQKSDLFSYIEYFRNVSIKTRKEGLLSIENDLSNNNINPFIKNGLQMVVDGLDSDYIRTMLDIKLEQMSDRHDKYIEVFSSAGGYAPTMGIVGTITSLVIILSNLSDAASLGPKIAVAFIATLYGLGTANIIWLPLANKLKELDRQEVKEKELFIEAIILILEGSNPNNVVNKLQSFLPESQQKVDNNV